MYEIENDLIGKLLIHYTKKCKVCEKYHHTYMNLFIILCKFEYECGFKIRPSKIK